MEKSCYEILFVQGTLFKLLFVQSTNLDYDIQGPPIDCKHKNLSYKLFKRFKYTRMYSPNGIYFDVNISEE